MFAHRCETCALNRGAQKWRGGPARWLLRRRAVRRNADCYCENLGSRLMIQPCNIRRPSSSK